MTWVLVVVERLMEWELVGETEVLGETPPHCHFVYHKSHVIWSEMKPGLPRWDITPSCLVHAYLLHARFWLSFHFDPEDGGYMSLRKSYWLSPKYMKFYSGWQKCSFWPLGEPQTKRKGKNICKNSWSANPRCFKYKTVQSRSIPTDHGAWLQG